MDYISDEYTQFPADYVGELEEAEIRRMRPVRRRALPSRQSTARPVARRARYRRPSLHYRPHHPRHRFPRPVRWRHLRRPLTVPYLDQSKLREGSEFIRWVQFTLNQVLNLSLPVDGFPGPDTRSAIRSFQRKNGLPVDGFVDPETRAALVKARQKTAASSLTQAGSPTAEPATSTGSTLQGPPPPEGEFWETEVNRSSRAYVRWVQASLNRIMNARLAVDGIRGTLTRQATIAFQRSRGLKADGVVGQQTERALVSAGAAAPPGTGGVPAISHGSAARPSGANTRAFLVAGTALNPPAGLSVRNFLDSIVHRFRGPNRSSQTVNEFIVHETVTRSVSDTVSVLRRRGLSVHMILAPDGTITQHGDLANDRLAHAGGTHNRRSVGIEVVNPYYPDFLRAGLPWGGVIDARWAHKGRYVLPTPQQAEALAQLISWITSPAARGLSIPRTWIGLSGNHLSMSRVNGAQRANPGIYAHTYFGHADGAWLVLYAILRLERGYHPVQAYAEAVRLGSTNQRTVSLP